MQVVVEVGHNHLRNGINCGDDDRRPIKFLFHRSRLRTHKKAHIHLRGVWARKKPLCGRLSGVVEEVPSTGKTLHQVKLIGRTQSPHPMGELCSSVSFFTIDFLSAGLSFFVLSSKGKQYAFLAPLLVFNRPPNHIAFAEVPLFFPYERGFYGDFQHSLSSNAKRNGDGRRGKHFRLRCGRLPELAGGNGVMPKVNHGEVYDDSPLL